MKNESYLNQVGRKPQVPASVIREYALRGLTRKQIATELNVSYRTVSSMVHRHKIDVVPDHHLKYPPAWFGETCRILIKHGWSATKIAGVLDVSDNTVRKYLCPSLSPKMRENKER